MKYLSLSILILLSFSQILGDEKVKMPQSTLIQQTSDFIKNSTKLVTAIATAFSAHYALEYVSTYMHEHGHGIASGGEYTVTMIPHNSMLDPWHGRTSWTSDYANPFFTTLAGPLAGITTTYLQMIMLKILDAYVHKKSLNSSFFEGLAFPITFFKKAIKTGKKYSSMIINSEFDQLLKNKTLTSLTIDYLLFLRMGRLVGESIYGLLPYHDSSPLVLSVGGGDGEKVWKMLLGSKTPLFTGNLAKMTLTVLMTPYVIGAMQAIYEKYNKNNECSLNTKTKEL